MRVGRAQHTTRSPLVLPCALTCARGLPASSMWGILLLWGAAAGCTSTDTNGQPVADAGADQLILVSRTLAADGSTQLVFPEVSLNAQGSLDPEGDYLTRFFWAFDTIPVGSGVTRDSFTINRDDLTYTRFTPDAEGIYGITLEVFDGQKLSLADYVQVEVRVVNGAPTADAGPDLNGAVGDIITFDGSQSADPDEDYLSMQWGLEVVPPDSALSAEAVTASATPYAKLVPDVPGVYVLSLRAFDGQAWSTPDFVTLTIASGNQSPIPVVTPSGTVTPCWDNPVTLDASGSSDPEGDPITYVWQVAETPYGSLVTDSALLTPTEPTTQVRLDVIGLYVFQVVLSDGQAPPASAVVALNFDGGSSQVPPEADPGGNRTVIGQVSCPASGCGTCDLGLALDGTYSFDLNQDPLQYTWRVLEGDATLNDPAAPITWLTGPALTPAGPGRSISTAVRVELVVQDCAAASEPAETSIFFSCEGL